MKNLILIEFVFIHLKNNVKISFVKIKIAEFKLKDILVFLDENGLVQIIFFDGKSGLRDLALYRISEKERFLNSLVIPIILGIRVVIRQKFNVKL